MSHKLEDIIKAAHRAKGTALIEIKNGEAVAVWIRQELKPGLNYFPVEHITVERNPDGSSPIVFK